MAKAKAEDIGGPVHGIVGIGADEGEQLPPAEQSEVPHRRIGEIPGAHHGDHVGIARTGGHLPLAMLEADDRQHLLKHVLLQEGRDRGAFVGAGRGIGDGGDDLADHGGQAGAAPHPVGKGRMIGLHRIAEIFFHPFEQPLPVTLAFMTIELQQLPEGLGMVIVEEDPRPLPLVILLDHWQKPLKNLTLIHTGLPYHLENAVIRSNKSCDNTSRPGLGPVFFYERYENNEQKYRTASEAGWRQADFGGSCIRTPNPSVAS